MKHYGPDRVHPQWVEDYLNGYEEQVPAECLEAVKLQAKRMNPEILKQYPVGSIICGLKDSAAGRVKVLDAHNVIADGAED